MNDHRSGDIIVEKHDPYSHMKPMLQTTCTRSKKHPLYCSFCGKTDSEVGYLVSGPTVFICNECVEVCREIGTQMVINKAGT